ncbi:hypothetical protein Tco_0487870 [Tanacetum coccineum]
MATLEFCDKHNMVAYLEKPEGTTASTTVNGEVELTANIDGQAKTITEASLRRHLKLEDNGGISSLPNIEIFEQLALMGYATDSDKLTIQKDIPLFPSMITAPETSPSRITSSPSLSPQHTPVSAPSTSPPPITETTPTIEEPAPMSHESPLQSVQSLRRDEGSMSLNELMDLETQLTNKVGSLENELMNTKKVYGSAITKLVKRVNKLEKQIKTGKARRRTKIVLSEDEAVEEDSYKHGRSLIKELDMDVDISLVPPHDAEIQEKISDNTEVLLEEEETAELIEEPTELVEDQGSGEKGEQEVTIADTALNTASVPISNASATPEVSTTAANLVNTGRTKFSTARPKHSTDSTKIESMKLEAIVEERRIFKCWFHYHTTNGHQFTMSNRHQELASPEQTDSGKDFSNPLMADTLVIPEQTATGKEISNPVMAGSFPKTTWPA